jgi:hypothetical protein
MQPRASSASTLHVPVKPLPITEPSDVKVTLRKPEPVVGV